ncbi:MAG: ATP-binding cassette domain-containing protein [Chitinophagaceae bacterium]|jgi:putative ABC transport system ATP-binding protein
MQLKIEQLIPVPLREKLNQKHSDVWLQNLLIESLDYVGVQAPSGTGKTTLIHSLCGLRQDYDGAIFWDNKNLRNKNGEEISELRTQKVSVIFQDMRLFPDLTAWENLELKRTLTNTVSAKEAAEWMNRLGIGDKMMALARTLSYGEQQRLAIIRSLLQPFSFLLMDEPFSHLDHQNTTVASQLILEVVKKNNAGLLLADLDENDFFPYNKTYLL